LGDEHIYKGRLGYAIKPLNINDYNLLIFAVFLIILSFIFLFGMGNVAAASNTIYVNITSGNDSWNGLNSTWINGINGPKASIKNATESANSGGTCLHSQWNLQRR
jgi:hypothetical protein